MDMQSAIVVKLPETFSADGARRLKQELRTKIGDGTPRVVIDLSKVKNIDLKGLEALLNCMDEIARRDGAIQLGGISAEAATGPRRPFGLGREPATHRSVHLRHLYMITGGASLATASF